MAAKRLRIVLKELEKEREELARAEKKAAAAAKARKNALDRATKKIEDAKKKLLDLQKCNTAIRNTLNGPLKSDLRVLAGRTIVEWWLRTHYHPNGPHKKVLEADWNALAERS